MIPDLAGQLYKENFTNDRGLKKEDYQYERGLGEQLFEGDFLESTQKAFGDERAVELTDSKARVLKSSKDEILERITSIYEYTTGERLESDTWSGLGTSIEVTKNKADLDKYNDLRKKYSDFPIAEFDHIYAINKKWDEFRNNGKDIDMYPDLFEAINDHAVESAKLIRSDYQRFKDSDDYNLTGAIVGTIGAGLTDPLNLVLMPTSKLLYSGSSLVKKAIAGGAENAIAELMSYPAIKEWRDELGDNYDLPELVSRILFSFGIGGGIPLVGKTIEKTPALGKSVAKKVVPFISEKASNIADASTKLLTKKKRKRVSHLLSEISESLEKNASNIPEHYLAKHVNELSDIIELGENLPFKLTKNNIDELQTVLRDIENGKITPSEGINRLSDMADEPTLKVEEPDKVSNDNELVIDENASLESRLKEDSSLDGYNKEVEEIKPEYFETLITLEDGTRMTPEQYLVNEKAVTDNIIKAISECGL